MEVSQGGQRVFVSHQCGGSGLYFTPLFVISLTSDNRQTKGWLLHRQVWQQTLSVWQQTSSRLGNRQFFFFFYEGLGLVVSMTEGLGIYSRPKAHSLQLEPDSRSLNLSRGMLTTL